MKRSFLTGLGLTKEQIDSIMDENGSDIENAKEKAQEKFEAETLKLQNKIDSLQIIVDDIPDPDPNATAAQAKLDALQSEFDTYKTNVEAEKINGAKRTVLQKLLQDGGANPKLLPLLEKEFDFSKIEVEGETIKGWDEMLKPVRENYSDIFGEVVEMGVKPATPPPTDPKAPQPKSLAEALNVKYKK